MRRRSEWPWPTAVAGCLAFCLGVTVGPLWAPTETAAPAPGLPSRASTAGPGGPGNPSLTIESPAFAEEGSEGTRLVAAWGAGPAGCSLRPSWFDWFQPDPSRAFGEFLQPYADSTVFEPVAWATRSSEVAVRSAALVACAGSNQTVTNVAFTNVTSFAALGLSNLSVDPAFGSIPAPVELTGAIAGGDPPFLIGVDWGDGVVMNATLGEAGNFSLPHTYGGGEFRPRVAVRDAHRVEVTGTVPAPVDISNGTVLSITSSLPVAEVAVPVRFEEAFARPPPGYGLAIACGLRPVGAPNTYTTNVTCTPPAAGTQNVTFEVVGPAPSFDLWLTRAQPVAAAVSVQVRLLDPEVEVGTPTYAKITVTGGIPPFAVSVVAGADPLRTGSPLTSDGAVLVAWTPSTAGAGTIGAAVVDALGVSAESTALKFPVAAPPSLLADPTVKINATVSTVRVVTTLVGGVLPLRFSASTDPVWGNCGPAVGEVSNEPFEWVGTSSEEGGVTLSLEGVDAAGGWTTLTLALGLPNRPVLDVPLVVSSGASTSPVLPIGIRGGVPPYALWVNSTNGPLWNGTGLNATETAVPLSGLDVGSTALRIDLQDARGSHAHANALALVPSSAVLGAVPGTDLSLPGALGLVLAATGAAAVLVRRALRRPAADRPVPDVGRVLERLLRPADGADRLTIELLAEEEGIPLDSVRDAVDRLVAAGRIRSESDAFGGEVLAWADDPDA